MNGIGDFYYITHIENLPSISKMGIYSHNLITKKAIKFTKIYDDAIVSRRQEIKTPDGKTLWDFANVYFQVRNPMLYRVMREKPENEIVVVSVSPRIMTDKAIFFTDGNAASSNTEILPIKEINAKWPRMQKRDLSREYWSAIDESKRRIMAECLVPDFIPPDYLNRVFVPDHGMVDKVKKLINRRDMDVSSEPRMFFLPYIRLFIRPNIWIAEGDMFFSKHHTLTVSVNTVGIMGKGIASRAKYQFPDVYVRYQDLCRKKSLRMGKPYLYKRSISFDDVLADEPSSISAKNDEKWFLLFATKNHWREMGDIKGIEEGLGWLKANLTKVGSKSLAIPALGCGLGGLEWKNVGPLMCRYLVNLGIPVEIYLPLERRTNSEYLTSAFLLDGALP